MTPNEAIEKYGLKITSKFVPFSMSRNANEKHKSLNWKVTLWRGEEKVFTVDYGAGEGHCPAYQNKQVKRLFPLEWANRVRAMLVDFEVENGRAGRYTESFNRVEPQYKSNPIEPSALDVIYSIVSDSSALDHPDYESFASEFGFDEDSRKGLEIYKTCLDIGLRLRAAVGDHGMIELQEAFQDY